jgi:hypothetical protein
MRARPLSLVLSVVACLSLAACSGGDDDAKPDGGNSQPPASGGSPLKGTWTGKVGTLSLTAEINQTLTSGSQTVISDGVLSSDNPDCFKNAPLQGTLVKDTVELVSLGSGNKSSRTGITVRGDLAGGKITAKADVIGVPEDCRYNQADLVLTKK